MSKFIFAAFALRRFRQSVQQRGRGKRLSAGCPEDNFYIFNRYDDIKDRAIREYMQYFATQKHESAKMKRIHELVEKYRQDPIARKAYMTLEQELNLRYKKGFKEGRAEGEAKGADAKNRELAKAFRDRGVAIDVIVDSTGLTPEQINAL